MPAEWERHQATWLGWPHEVTDWPGKFATIPWAFAEIVRLLSEVERVFLLVEDRAAEVRVRSILKNAAFETRMATWPTIISRLTGGQNIRIIKKMRWWWKRRIAN
jgi:agmatine/peptidylarginine deiminase